LSNSIVLDPQNRFAFGKNWSRFLENLNEHRILEAEKSLKEKLNCVDLKGLVFLDIGYAPKDDKWVVERGSVLDQDFLKKFGQVDVVYSWGVLHHTGHMYKAFENVAHLVKDGGTLFISIYNNQGISSKIWTIIKKSYNNYKFLRSGLLFFCGIWLWKYRIAWGLMRYGNPLKFISEYGNGSRGMSAYHDLVDWIGGYPFEVAKPEEVFDFFKSKKFELQRLETCAGKLGCNEFVFRRSNK
jgi:2-polyprenyl-6-hydroxyphenyl methylase/3-demethylubiquinone-9 3-methyltransferase